MKITIQSIRCFGKPVPCIGKYNLYVQNKGKGKLRFWDAVSGTPAQLQKLLTPLRWTIRKLKGTARRQAIDSLLKGYRVWTNIRTSPKNTLDK